MVRRRGFAGSGFRSQAVGIVVFGAFAVRVGFYLEGQWDFVSRLITPITHIVTLLIPIINPLTKSPWPSKYA